MIGITEKGDAALDRSWLLWVMSGNPAVLITKNPVLLQPLIKEMITGDVECNVIVHCTITGYGSTVLEPGVRPWEECVRSYLELCNILGKDRVVLRIDPIIPTNKGLVLAQKIIQNALGRVRISFLDNYPHVKDRFKQSGLPVLDYDFHAPIITRELYTKELNMIHPVEICGEPDMKCVGCISKQDCSILGVKPVATKGNQRKNCVCLAMKTELLGGKGIDRGIEQCHYHHGCLYCFWK